MSTHLLPDLSATQALGARLGALAPPGTVVALVGDLGAGKTSLAQGVARGLGIEGPVQSPTFVVVSTHEGGRLPLHHADVYRVDDPMDLEQTGLEDLLEEPAVGLVEWADKHPHVLPADHLRITLSHTAAGRTAVLEATGPVHAALLEALGG